MVNNEYQYYYVRLKGGIDTIPFRHSNSKIVAVLLSDNKLHEIITNEVLSPSDSRGINLEYEYIEPISKDQTEKISDIIFSLTSDDIENYKKELNKIKTLQIENNSFGIGDKLSRKIFSKKS